jgi:hypothetical protein
VRRRRSAGGEDNDADEEDNHVPHSSSPFSENSVRRSSLLDAAKAADGVTPCTPYPTIRLDQLKKKSGPRPTRFYLAGVVAYVRDCARDSHSRRYNALLRQYGSVDEPLPLGLVLFTESALVVDFLREVVFGNNGL